MTTKLFILLSSILLWLTACTNDSDLALETTGKTIVWSSSDESISKVSDV